jgi:NAD(P)-dependent dehydrogenase (short-subunit alcohol dehydrogenase family)
MLDHYDVPHGRFGTLDEVDAAIVFLVSAAGGYVTSTQLVVHGRADTDHVRLTQLVEMRFSIV